jgi:hypothetical protein
MKLRISLVLLLALTPALSYARPKTATAHMRPQLFRDRAPKARTHDTRARGPHGTPVKNPPVLSQGDPFQL